MSDERYDIYPVQKRDARGAAAVLADAFQHDPIWSTILRDATPEQRAIVFESPVRYAVKYGEIVAPSENLEGIAAWMPGDLADMTPWRLLRSGAMWAGLRLGLAGIRMGADMARKMIPIFSPMEADRKEHMRGKPYIYLQIIGVAAAYQGQGYGGRMLRALIQKSEQTGLPLYLETGTGDNVRMYQRFGFRVVNEILLPIIDLPMWEMTRG